MLYTFIYSEFYLYQFYKMSKLYCSSQSTDCRLVAVNEPVKYFGSYSVSTQGIEKVLIFILVLWSYGSYPKLLLNSNKTFQHILCITLYHFAGWTGYEPALHGHSVSEI